MGIVAVIVIAKMMAMMIAVTKKKKDRKRAASIFKTTDDDSGFLDNSKAKSPDEKEEYLRKNAIVSIGKSKKVKRMRTIELEYIDDPPETEDLNECSKEPEDLTPKTSKTDSAVKWPRK